MKIRFLFGKKKTNRFNFEDRVIVVEGFYTGCTGYIKSFQKKRLGNIVYDVLLENGVTFNFRTPLQFEESFLRHENEDKEREEDSINV